MKPKANQYGFRPDVDERSEQEEQDLKFATQCLYFVLAGAAAVLILLVTIIYENLV